MKLLLTRLEPVKNLDVLKGQMTGARQLGHEVNAIYVDGPDLVFSTKDNVRRITLPAKSSARRAFAAERICADIEANHYDDIYLRADMVDRSLVKIAKCAKEKSFDAKVILEVTDYYGEGGFQKRLQEAKHSGNHALYRQERRRYLIHSLLLGQFKRAADTIVIYGKPEESIWGIPAIGLERGITVGHIKLREAEDRPEDPVRIIGVAEYPKHCGFDRIISGMAQIRDSLPRERITFDVVGREEDTAALRAQVSREGLEEYVHFLGDLGDEALNGIWDRYSVGISALGLYRSGLDYASPRNMKLYCAAGLPIVYAFDSLSLEDGTEFALKMSNSDAPINLVLISEFVWRCRLNARLAKSERKFADRNYDWRVVMKRLIEFTATGRREV